MIRGGVKGIERNLTIITRRRSLTKGGVEGIGRDLIMTRRWGLIRGGVEGNERRRKG